MMIIYLQTINTIHVSNYTHQQQETIDKTSFSFHFHLFSFHLLFLQ